jgi:hypothetical protein
MDQAEEVRKLNKTISDAVGSWHQSVLGLAPNWMDMGATGGVLDIRTVPGYNHPKWNKPIVAEVKNRFNTIKASDEKHIWDVIDQTARSSGAVGYLIQIVPKTPHCYDEEWVPSGRSAKEHVRYCDGVTGYELAFGYHDALPELLSAFPKIIDDVLREAGRPAVSFSADAGALERKGREVFGIDL